MEDEKLQYLQMKLVSIGATIDRKMELGRYGVEAYDDVKTLIELIEAIMAEQGRSVGELQGEVDEMKGELDELRGRMTDMEARDFADMCEREIERENDRKKWGGTFSSFVDHELEGISDRITRAMEMSAEGEDVSDDLLDLDMSLQCLIAHIMA